MNIKEWNERYSAITNKYNAMYHNVAVNYGFSDTQFWVLYILFNFHKKRTYTQNEIADDLGIPKQTVNSAIAKLVDNGYLTLTKRPVPRNSKSVSLTDSGTELCNKCILPVMEAEERALSKLTPKEHELFLSIFEKRFENIYKEVSSLLEKNS